MPNINDFEIVQAAQQEVLQMAYNIGKDQGEGLTAMFEAGEIKPGQLVNLIIPIGRIKPERFSDTTRFLMAAGSEEGGVTGNSIIVACGIYTGGSSLVKLEVTKSPRAKACFQLSILCSGFAILTGGASVLARECAISAPAALSEAAGFGFMQVGNWAHDKALEMEGKKPPVNNPVRQRFYHSFKSSKDVSFIIPQYVNNIALSDIIAKIPFQQIGRLVGLSFSIYYYSKMIIACYRYGIKLANQIEIKRRRKIIFKSAAALCLSLQNSDSYRHYTSRVIFVYRFACVL